MMNKEGAIDCAVVRSFLVQSAIQSVVRSKGWRPLWIYRNNELLFVAVVVVVAVTCRAVN